MFQNAWYYTEGMKGIPTLVLMPVCMRGGLECMYIMHVCVCMCITHVCVFMWATSCWSVCSCLRFSSSPFVSFSFASSSLDLISSDSCKHQSQNKTLHTHHTTMYVRSYVYMHVCHHPVKTSSLYTHTYTSLYTGGQIQNNIQNVLTVDHYIEVYVYLKYSSLFYNSLSFYWHIFSPLLIENMKLVSPQVDIFSSGG